MTAYYAAHTVEKRAKERHHRFIASQAWSLAIMKVLPTALDISVIFSYLI
jgi:hypothetical protein